MQTLMRALCLSLLVISGFFGYSQKALPEFGEIPMDDIKMTTCRLDSSAAAVILFDKGEMNLDDHEVVYKRHVRIKILNNSGFEWADHAMHLDRTSERLSKLKGSTYNLVGGQIVESKMEETSIFKSKYNKFQDQLKFTLPNVKEGSVIEYSYVLHAYYVPDWQFQYSIPVLWSEYETRISSLLTFRKDMQGFIPLTRHETKVDIGYERYVMTDVPPFRTEPFITTPEDYISKIHFYRSGSRSETWGDIVKDYNESENFGGVLKGSGFLKKNVEELTAGMTEPQKKLEVIYAYVKANVQWNQETDRIPDHPFKKVLEEKTGSSSEINLLLVTMLRKAGLNANPVFISTRDNGMVRQFVPLVSQFNDVICLVVVGEKKILVDATENNLPITALPERCINGSGLILYETGPDWVEITSARSRKAVSTDLRIDESGELTGQLSVNYSGIAGGDIRKSFKDLGEEKYLKAMLAGKTWEVEKSEFDNMTNPAENVKEKYQLVIRDHALANGPVIYLNPFVVGQIDENPFKSEKRAYPVDFATPFERLYMAKIVVSDSLTVEELPKPKVIALPGNTAKFTYNVSLLKNTISITSQFIINKSVFSQDEYPFLREFYNHVVAKQAEQIVLKKK